MKKLMLLFMLFASESCLGMNNWQNVDKLLDRLKVIDNKLDLISQLLKEQSQQQRLGLLIRTIEFEKNSGTHDDAGHTSKNTSRLKKLTEIYQQEIEKLFNLKLTSKKTKKSTKKD